MKIAFIIGTFPKITQTFILNQITGLIDRGQALDIYPLKRGNNSKLKTIIKEYRLSDKIKYIPFIPGNKAIRLFKGIKIFTMKLKKNPVVLLRSLNCFKYGKKAISLNMFYETIPFLEGGKYDIIHCHFGPLGLKGMILKELGILEGKLITSFRGYDLGKIITRKGDNFYKELFLKGDLFLPVCDYFKTRLIELGCEKDKIIVHRSGIDCNKFTFSPPKFSNTGNIIMLSVGRLIEKKGFEYSIRGMAKVLKDINTSKINYKIIGEGPLKNYLKKLTKELGIGNLVEFLGERTHEEVINIIGRSHFLIAPSVTSSNGDLEGIPNVLKEAMATGLPVISTFHSGIPELVKNGTSGFLVSERNIHELAEKIRFLIQHPEIWHDMGRAGRNVIEECYDINKLNDQLINIYQGLLNK